jgi:hypothetical protein
MLGAVVTGLRTRMPLGAPLGLAVLGWLAVRRPQVVVYRASTGRARTEPIRDADRERVLDELAQHAADGRITLAEHRDRSGQALTARTRSDLEDLVEDLPVPQQPRQHRRRRRGRLSQHPD